MRRNKLRRNKKADVYESTAEDIVDSYYCLVLLGPGFSFTSGKQVIKEIAQRDYPYTLKQLMQPPEKYMEKKSQGGLGQSNEDLFFGFWGSVYNELMNLPENEINTRTLAKWRHVFYDQNDLRYVDKKILLQRKKNKNLDLDEWKFSAPPTDRFFVVTDNLNHSVARIGEFHRLEFLETEGNICQWQCQNKCTFKKWLIPKEFKFLVDKETGKAPKIKFVEKDFLLDETQNPGDVVIENKFDVGDKELYNPNHPRGKFLSHEKIPGDKVVTRKLKNMRGNYYRYYNPSMNEKIKMDKLKKNISNSVNIDESDLYSSALTSKKTKALFLPVFVEENSNDGKKHEKEKEMVKKNAVRGQFSSFLIDPMIHQHTYFTEMIEKEIVEEKNESNKKMGESLKFNNDEDDDENERYIFGGSQSKFNISLLIQENDENTLNEREPKIIRDVYSTYLPNKSPTLIKKKEISSVYQDRIILPMTEHENIVLPENGTVTLIMENVTTSKQYKQKSGKIGTTLLPEQKSFGMIGVYTIKQYKPKGYQNHLKLDGKKYEFNELLVDYVMGDTKGRRIILRTIHGLKEKEQGTSEVILKNVIIDLPIAFYRRKVENLNQKYLLEKDDESENESKGENDYDDEIGENEKEKLNESDNDIVDDYHSIKRSKTTELPSASMDTPVNVHRPFEVQSESIITEKDKINDTQKPTLNRIMCPYCRDFSRPSLKMGRRDRKWVKTPVKRLKEWQKNVIKGLQDDNKKTLLILELGCGPKLSKISEQFLKQTKVYNAKLVKISPIAQKINEDKKEDQIVVIKENCARVIKTIEEHVKCVSKKVNAPYE